MQRLVEDLLAYSRVGSRSRPPGPVDLDLALDRALMNLEVALGEAEATVTRGALPIVSADDFQIVQLLQNLVGNALKFRGDHPARVHVDAERLGDEWTIRVRDEGIGIAEEHRERIFSLFHRLHTTDEYPGSGIGLAICRKIVARNGGRIWVESTPGAGATFHFTLPITDSPPAVEP
jgi:light-regulated signal transduction histidine kinase (bacteriophytochrome)